MKSLGHASVSDEVSIQSVRELDQLGYLSEPHGAIAYRALRDQLQDGEYGLFLGTAHPAKFKEVVENILGKSISLPTALAERKDMTLLSHYMPDDFAKLRNFLINLDW